ncbi:MAG: NAD(P)/FAD-dependent oxidoreductase [Candidatus Micrarchaeota archaeon]|nr:NAD(P)/FAD-dependent oxidoreductase [Candidatus Micrarchaeota archaeon]
MEHFDIAIIGAGPAGTFAAYRAAQLGAQVCVFEEHERIGEPVHCGECLSELACKRLNLSLPDEAISQRMKGIRLVYPDRNYSYIEEPGYTLEKERFEQYLAKLGAEAGATYKMRHRVAGLSYSQGTWAVSTTQGAYAAKILIDASGVAGAASRLLYLNPEPKKVVGLQYELSPIENDGFIDFFLWQSLAPRGYLWIIPKKNSRANVGLVTDDAPNARRYLDRFISQFGLSEKKKVGKMAFGGFIPASGPLPKTFDDGILLCGDAAGFTSPMFEGGTGLAMTSGKFAAEVAVGALKKGDASRAALAKYESLWRAEFPDYSRLLSAKKAVYNFTDAEWSRIGRLIPRNLTDVTLAEKAAVGARVLAAAPHFFAKGFISAMDALGKSRAKHYGW